MLVPAGWGRALAQTSASNASAAELVERAQRAREIGRLDEAIDGFARAYQISGDSSLLFFLAQTHRDAGHSADALRIFQTYVRRDPQGARREIAERQIRELERQIEPGSETPARAQDRSQDRSSAGSGKTTVTPAPAAPGPHPDAVAPSAAVVPRAPEARPVAEPRAVEPGVDLTSTPAPAAASGRQPPLPRWVPWVAMATTVALGSGAIVAGLSASRRYDELRNSCGQTVDGCAASQIDDVRSRARRANILWALTGAAAIGTGITIYVNTSAAGVAGIWRL